MCPCQKLKMRGSKMGEGSKSERSHRRGVGWRELKVEEEIEGLWRESILVRLKCESQQGVSSSRYETFVCLLCVCLSVSCYKLVTTARLWDLQLVCGPYPLTPYLTHSKTLSNAAFNFNAYDTRSLTKTQTHGQWMSSWVQWADVLQCYGPCWGLSTPQCPQ